MAARTAQLLSYRSELLGRTITDNQGARYTIGKVMPQTDRYRSIRVDHGYKFYLSPTDDPFIHMFVMNGRTFDIKPLLLAIEREHYDAARPVIRAALATVLSADVARYLLQAL